MIHDAPFCAVHFSCRIRIMRGFAILLKIKFASSGNLLGSQRDTSGGRRRLVADVSASSGNGGRAERVRGGMGVA